MKLITRPLTEDLRVRLRKDTKSASPFSAKYSDTLKLLDREVWHIAKAGADLVLMIDIEERHLRLDGTLRADARPASDNVALAVETKNGPLIFPCGRFWKWQDNVRAIALGMEALRKVDRYGISPNGEQYRGWQALPPGTPMPATQMTVDEAARFFAEHLAMKPEAILRGWSQFGTEHYRRLARSMHPDVGGDPALFRRLTEARDLLAAQ